MIPTIPTGPAIWRLVREVPGAVAGLVIGFVGAALDQRRRPRRGR